VDGGLETGLVVEQRRHFAVVGKAPGREFGIQGLAVGDDLERRAGAGGKLNLDAILF
jgi:hypothetical protein